MPSRPLRIVMAGCGVLFLASCADASTSATTDAPELPEKYYAGLALPAEEPEGLTAVRVEQFAHPERDGQRVMLMFGRDTVYVCSRPISGQVEGATKCPYPGKQSLLTADVGTLRTVYALDSRDAQVDGKGSTESGRNRIRAVLGSATELEQSPEWFAEMVNDRGEEARALAPEAAAGR